MITLLWLDDIRDPFDGQWIKHIKQTLKVNFNTISWVKSYDEFVNWINENGLPDIICFDHDLADEHYRSSMYNPDGHYSNYYTNGTFKEKTGYDCAKWLGEYCIDHNLKVPDFYVQSMNPIGRSNIIGYLNNVKTYLNDSLK